MKAECVIGGFISLAVMATLSVPAAAAPPAGRAAKSGAVTLESIPGSTVKRVTLSATAAKRLGIETDTVSTQPIVRRQMVGGLVVPAPEKHPEPASAEGFAGFARLAAAPTPQPPQPVAIAAPAPAANEAWVLVTLTRTEWDRLAQDKPARLLPLATRDRSGPEVLARPSGMPPLEDTKRSMLRLYYVVSGPDHGLALNKRMRIELQLSGGDEVQKVVPYGAVYYDAKGAAWVYVSTAPLVFERRRIGVERIIGNLAVLSDGPSVGTPVVIVGAALLYGAEIFGK